MPVASSIQWKPLRDSHYVIASLQPGQGGLRQIFVAQSVLLRLRTLARAMPADQLLGLLIGQRWDCPLSGTRWLFIDALIEGAAAIPDATTLTADLRALLGRRRGNGVECVGWYSGTLATESHLSRTLAAVHGAMFAEAWQTALVLANGGEAGAFFLRDTRDVRWFQAPFYEVTETIRDSKRQPAQPTAVSWPEYITTTLVTPIAIAEPAAERFLPSPRAAVAPAPVRGRPVRVEVVREAARPEATATPTERKPAPVRETSARLSIVGATARTSVGNGVKRLEESSGAVSGAIAASARAVKASIVSLGSRLTTGAAAAVQAQKDRAAKARQARAEREAEARRRQEEHARHAAEQRAREAAARAAREEAERAARVEAERVARERAERDRQEAERAAQLRAERAAALEAERRAQREAEQRARLEAAERARVEAERRDRESAELARTQALERARIEAEKRAQAEAAERARKEAAERARQQAADRAREEAAERARQQAADRAREEAAERARQEAAERARQEAIERARQEAAAREKQAAEDRARRDAERQAAVAPPAIAPDRAVSRVVAKERATAGAAVDLEDTTAADGPYRYLALARREGFQVSAKLERGTPERPETVWLLNETDSGLSLTVVTTDEEVREASLHYNLRTDDDALLRITPPEHRDVESRIIYVREPCIAELRSRCRRLRATGALAREWKVTPALHPSAIAAQYR